MTNYKKISSKFFQAYIKKINVKHNKKPREENYKINAFRTVLKWNKQNKSSNKKIIRR